MTNGLEGAVITDWMFMRWARPSMFRRGETDTRCVCRPSVADQAVQNLAPRYASSNIGARTHTHVSKLSREGIGLRGRRRRKVEPNRTETTFYLIDPGISIFFQRGWTLGVGHGAVADCVA